ncbi:MAG: hypothetical protein AAF694_10025 [Bacteroidota bacterium]
MKQSRTLVIKSVDTSVFQAKAAVGFSLLAMLLPFILHLLPNPSGYPIGAKLIPLFYAPFIAVLFFRFPIALAIGIFAPLANFLFIGQPSFPSLIQLGLEITGFICLSHLLKNYKGIRWVNAPFSFIGAKMGVWGLFTALSSVFPGIDPPAYFETTVAFAAPGLFILWALNLAMLSFKTH